MSEYMIRAIVNGVKLAWVIGVLLLFLCMAGVVYAAYEKMLHPVHTFAQVGTQFLFVDYDKSCNQWVASVGCVAFDPNVRKLQVGYYGSWSGYKNLLDIKHITR